MRCSEYEKFRVKQDRLYVSDFDDLMAAERLFAEVQKAENKND